MKKPLLNPEQRKAFKVVHKDLPPDAWFPVSPRQVEILKSIMNLGLLGYMSFNESYTAVKRIDLTGFKKNKPLKTKHHAHA